MYQLSLVTSCWKRILPGIASSGAKLLLATAEGKAFLGSTAKVTMPAEKTVKRGNGRTLRENCKGNY
jgi:hypothetical protein